MAILKQDILGEAEDGKDAAEVLGGIRDVLLERKNRRSERTK
jgi:hypothetical protein